MPDASGFTMSGGTHALYYDDDLWEEAGIPRRPWIAPGYFLRGAITEIVGPGGISKSALMIAYAVALALGQPFHRMHPTAPCRVMLYNVEDDADEQRRRLSGALANFGGKPSDVQGKIARIGPKQVGTLFRRDDDDSIDGRLVATEAMSALKYHIVEFKPDVLILDPLVELHDIEENDNTGLRSVMAEIRALGTEHNLAPVILHHTRKGGLIPGDPDSSRGASAIVGAARVVLTISGMSEDEAKAFNVPDDIRRQFFRLDGGKANYSRLTEVEWFERAERLLSNGDTVAIPEPWSPPVDVVTPEIRTKLEAGIARGHAEGPWSPLLANKHARSIKHLFAECGVTTLPGQTELLNQLLSDGFEKAQFRDKARRPAWGIRTSDGQPRSASWISPKDGLDEFLDDSLAA